MLWKMSLYVHCVVVLLSPVCFGAPKTVGKDSSRSILILPVPSTSHVNNLIPMAKVLKIHGHHVYAAISSDGSKIQKMFTDIGVDIITYQDTGALKRLDTVFDLMGESGFKDKDFFFREIRPKGIRAFNQLCYEVVSDKVFIRKVKKLEIDVILMDFSPPSVCLFIFPYHMQIPHITVSPVTLAWASGSPLLPSFMPSVWSDLGPDMTFIQRIKNIGSYILATPAFQTFVIPENSTLLELYAPSEQYIGYYQVMRNSQIMLIPQNNLVLDYATPLLPHAISMGGIDKYPWPAQALPKELESFMTNAKHGVIVVSFGSIAKKIPFEISLKLLQAFRNVRQSVIWRHNGRELPDVPSNVKTMSWLPQKELLGHPNTKLFITHCGSNGQHEAVFYGVPMIGFPIFAEQAYNAARMEYRGYGVKLNMHAFTSDELLSTIHKITENPKFEDNIEKAAIIFREQPPPGEVAAYWIEHVMKYGSSHLRSHALQMPWYQYWMIDILAFLYVSLIVILLVLYCVVKLIIKKCCSQKSKKD